MYKAEPRKLQVYQTLNGREPFTGWLNSFQDRRTQTRIRKRLARLKAGNFGDYRSVGEGVFELRLDFGAGYRIYFGEVDNITVLLLCAGDKSSQARDINRAKSTGRNIRKHTHEKIQDMARNPNGTTF